MDRQARKSNTRVYFCQMCVLQKIFIALLHITLHMAEQGDLRWEGISGQRSKQLLRADRAEDLPDLRYSRLGCVISQVGPRGLSRRVGVNSGVIISQGASNGFMYAVHVTS